MRPAIYYLLVNGNFGFSRGVFYFPEVMMVVTSNSANNATSVETGKTIDPVDSRFLAILNANKDILIEHLKKYDQQNNGTVAKTELRNALESVAREPISSHLFQKMTDGIGVAVDYAKCLQKIGVAFKVSTDELSPLPDKSRDQSALRLTRSLTMLPSSAADIESSFKQKLLENVTKVLRGLRLFDYNRDGRVQKHELKKAFDTHIMKLTDQQFERIWSRYEVNHNSGTTTTNYQDFLRRLGVTDEQLASVGSGAKSVLTDSVVAAYAESPVNATLGRKDSAASALRPLSAFRHVVRNEDLPSHQLSESNIDFLENQLRAGVVNNRSSIIKMFHIFDKDLSGYVTIDDLHKTINNFVVQLSYPAFQQVMERTGLKASHTIAWREFLRKFDPITINEQQNGSFIPMRGNHKSYPVKGTEQTLSLNTLLTKLHEHIRNGYPSLKEAFLTINETRDGVMSMSKLQKVLSDRVKISVTDAQMAQLWAFIQPAGSPPLDYQRFVQIFEITDTADGHKWLQSCHRVNEMRHPAPLAGPPAVEIVRQHVGKHWSSIARNLAALDRKRLGTVPVAQLKQLLVDHAGPIDDATFTKWIDDCTSSSKTAGTEVNYREFFANLGVEINPGDMDGLSLRITEENALSVDRLLEDQRNRHQIEATKAADRANAMTCDEVVVRLRDRFEQRSGNFFKTFAYFAKKRKQSYRLSRAGFRKMLAHMGYLLTDENFAELCSRLTFTGNHMTYDDFARSFEQLFFQRPSDADRKDNHRYNEIRGGEQLLGANAAYDLLKKKLLMNFDTLKKAFEAADIERRGIIGGKGVLRIFDALNIPIDPNCIPEIMQRLSQELKRPPTEMMSMEMFRDIFEIREDERGHKWTSDHRFNKQIEGDGPATAEGAFQMLMLKLRTHFNSPTEAFLAADSRRTGRITKRDFAKFLAKVHMSAEEPLLSGVWDLIDPLREGSVNMETFFRRSGVDNPADGRGGVSEKIIAKSELSLEEMLAKMKERHQVATDRQVAVGQTLTAEVALATIAQKLVDSGQSLDSLFAKFDVRKRGFLSAQQMQTILHTYHLFLLPNEEQRFFGMIGIGINGRSGVSLEAFKAAFDDQHLVVGNEEAIAREKAKAEQTLRFPPPANPNKPNAYANNAEIWRRARLVFTKHSELMQKAFAAMDRSASGRLALADFERVLVAFCGPRVPLVFVRSRYPPAPDGSIDYRAFLSSVSTATVPAVAAAAMINAHTNPNEQSAGIRRLAHAVRSRHYQLVAGCEEIDQARYGVLSVADFRNVLQQFTITITDQLYGIISTLPDVVPLNENGHVLYREALSNLATVDQILPAPASGDALPPLFGEPSLDSPRDSASSLPYIDGGPAMTGRAYSTSSRASSTIASSVITDLFGGDFADFGFGGLPMVDATRAETQLQPAMVKRWRRFHRACRVADPQQSGFLPTQTVDKIFQEIGITLPDGDFQIICRKYDMRNGGSFAYRHFLRQMILTNSSDRVKTLSSDQTTVATSTGPMVRALLSTAERWRDLRRWFRSQPQSSAGVVSIGQLRHGLRTVADANMTEEEFAELSNRLDPQNSGYIRYDDLFRLALRSTNSK